MTGIVSASDQGCGLSGRRQSVEICAAELRAAALPARADAPINPATALLARADALRAADDLPAAERALACAAAQPGVADDPRAHYELVRRLGVVDYGLARPVEALDRFECALRLAEGLEDRAEVARQLKNMGSSLRRIGDYAGAMRALTRSLELQRASGDAAVGPVLNNIADVHREMEQRDDAERYYREALDALRSSGDVVQSMHVYDSLADMAIDRRDTRTATSLLRQALQDLRAEVDSGEHAAGALRYQLLIHAGLIRAELTAGDTAAARGHLADALALAETHGLKLPAQLQLEAARTERLSGRNDAAVARLRTAIAATGDAPAQQAPLLRELSLALQESGKQSEALDALHRAYDRETEDLRAQRDRGLAWSNARLNLNESRRQLAEADARSQRRTLQLWVTIISAFAVLALVALLFQRRHQRARQADAVRRARYEEALAHYRREYDALLEDRHLLQALLDSREDALVLIDGDGIVQAANRAACEVLQSTGKALVGAALADGFQPASSQALREALVQMEDAGTLALSLGYTDLRPRLHAELRQWEQGDGKIVVTLRPAALADTVMVMADDAHTTMAASGDSPAQMYDPAAAQPVERVDLRSGPAATALDSELPLLQVADLSAASLAGQAGDDAADDENAQRQTFRRELVELMLALVDAWERSTGHNRIELAERSRIWRVNIDDGRLRARAMERYLSLSKLPRNPRWRDVLRSAYFVLSHCEAMPPQSREDLQRRVDAILNATRRQALADGV